MCATSIPNAFRKSAAIANDLAAVYLPEKTISFAQLNQRTDAIAAALANWGLQPEERVGLYCSNSPEFIIVYLGILKAGGIVVPLNLLLSIEEIRYILTDCAARVLFYHGSFAASALQIHSQLPELALGVQIDVGLSEQWTLQGLNQTSASSPHLPDDLTSTVAAILYTSGTTGRPKGAQLTHGNLLANTASVAQALDLKPHRDRVLLVLPLFHAFAATVGMLTPLLHGFSLVPLPRFDLTLVSNAIEATGATLFLGVPSLYTLLLKLTLEQRQQWRSIRYCVSGGAALPKTVLEAFEANFGIPLLEGDGPTECSPVTCVNPLYGVRKPGSVGLPIPGLEMAICDEQGAPLPDGSWGEVCVRGPSVMKGYWNAPQANAESFFGNWFRTGDVGYRDSEGYFFLVDRKKDLIIVNGMNVYPRVLEEVLYQHPAIAEVAVVGEPHPLHGEIPVAHVVPKSGVTINKAQIRAYCRDRLGRHEQPRRVVIRESLPKTATGKILKRELRSQGEWERGVNPWNT